MNIHNIFQLEGMEFPAGRKTRVMIGENGAVNGEYFCQGYVVIYPGGSIPLHDHEPVETYTIVQGRGEITIDGETALVQEGDFVYIEKNKPHRLVNVSSNDLHLMFVYAPKIIVSHWAQELKNTK